MTVRSILSVAELVITAVWLGISPVAEAIFLVALLIGATFFVRLTALPTFVVGKASLTRIFAGAVIIAPRYVPIVGKAATFVAVTEMVSWAVFLDFARLQALTV